MDKQIRALAGPTDQSREAGVSFRVISSSPRFTVIVVSTPTFSSAMASV